MGLGIFAGVGSAQADEAAAPQPPSEARQLYAEGKALLRAGQRGEAAAKLLEAAARAQAEALLPEEQALFFRLLGLALSGSQRESEAVQALKRSLELDASDAECHLELGQSFARLRQHADAQREAVEALRLGLSDAGDAADARQLAASEQARQLFAEGRQLLKKRELRAAAARLQQSAVQGRAAGQSADELAVTHYVLGLTLSIDSRDDEAIAALRRALELAPSDADSHLELARLLLRSDQPAEARRESERAISLGLADAQDQKDARRVVAAARTELVGGSKSYLVGSGMGESVTGMLALTAGPTKETAGGGVDSTTKAAGNITVGGSAKLTSGALFTLKAPTISITVAGNIKANGVKIGGGKVKAAKATFSGMVKRKAGSNIG